MGARDELAQPWTVGISETLRQVCLDVLRPLLIALSTITWLAVVFHFGYQDAFWPGWGTPVILLVVLGGAYAIQFWSFDVATRALILGLTAAVAAQALVATGEDLSIIWFVPVVLIAASLHRMIEATMSACTATAVLLLGGTSSVAALGSIPSAQILLVIWLTVIISWFTTRSLYATVAGLARTQHDLVTNLVEVRRHRGELAGTTRQLKEALLRLESANHALNWARIEATEARRLKAQFAAHVSHELRTPVNLIVGFTDVMLNVPQAYRGAPLPTAYQVDLQAVHRNAQQLQGLIDDILDLSQLDAHEMPLMPEAVSVRVVIVEAVDAIRQLLKRKRLALTLDVASDVGSAYLDPLRIRQVLLNLLSNASRHTSSGEITVRARSEGETVVITVADTGNGIDPREIPRLFEPFQRHAAGTSTDKGWGLGLPICKRFVELHGGTIQAESSGVPGQGAVFTVRLPRYASPIEPALHDRATSNGEADARTRSPRPAIVVADRHPRVVNLFRRHLGEYQVYGADSSDATDLAREVRAHALVVDLPDSPHQPSWERYSALAAKTGLRVIGCSMPSNRGATDAVGLADFLVKPITREALLATVERICPQARTIALIDDDPHMVRLVSRMLRSSKKRYSLLRAYDGEEGLDIIRRGRPDIVLLDLVMPRLDGLSLLERLRSDPALAGIPVVAVSAQGTGELAPSPDGQGLALISGQALTVTQIVRGVRALLEVLPSDQGAALEPLRAPESATIASAVS